MASAAEAVARRYLALVTAGDADGLAAMYAPQGYLDLPDGGRIPGRAAVLDFYRALFRRGGPKPEPLSFVSEAQRCDVEIVAVTPDGNRQRAIDCFAIDEAGLITALTVYTRASLAVPRAV